MKISTKGRYGARAALELALRYGMGPVMVRELAESQDISERYLEQILNTLRTAELVKSTRGARGGYELTRDPSEITIGEIIRALEGPMDVVPCILECDYGKRAECVTCYIWQEVTEAIEKVMDAVTLKDMIERHRKLGQKKVIDYHI